MSNLALTRIDSRLIHGQLAIQWCYATRANVIVVANDEVAASSTRQTIMNMAVPSGVEAFYWSIDKTIQQLQTLKEEDTVFLVCECVQDVLKLKEGGVFIEKVNVGNMPYSEGKYAITENVAIDDADRSAFTRLKELGVEVEIRKIPDFAAEDASKLFK